MKEIFEKIYAWVRPDGMLHIFACLVLFLILAPAVGAIFATILCLAAGVAKEVYDRKHDGETAEWHDIYCDAIGTALGVLLFAWDKFLLL